MQRSSCLIISQCVSRRISLSRDREATLDEDLADIQVRIQHRRALQPFPHPLLPHAIDICMKCHSTSNITVIHLSVDQRSAGHFVKIIPGYQDFNCFILLSLQCIVSHLILTLHQMAIFFHNILGKCADNQNGNLKWHLP